MHILIGVGIVAGLIAFAFGPKAAQIFIGGILALCAAGVLALVAYVVTDLVEIYRPEPPVAVAVHMGDGTGDDYCVKNACDAQLVAMRACLAKHNWAVDAQGECSK